MHVKILTSESDIIRAKELLYSVYVEGLGWEPWRASNKSNIHIEDGINGRILADDFDHKALVFGAFHNGALKARVRIITGSPENIELCRYTNIRNVVEWPELAEINRLACAANTATPALLYSLMSACLGYQKKRKVTSITATSNKSLKKVYGSMGCIALKQFKYEHFDECLSTLFVVDQPDTALTYLNKRLNRFELRNQKTLSENTSLAGRPGCASVPEPYGDMLGC